MGDADIQQFRNAVPQSSFFQDWTAAVHACSRLSMVDMLRAVGSLNSSQREMLGNNAMARLSRTAFARIQFAIGVVEQREIYDLGLPGDQVNDGREYLGCTRLGDDGVRGEIESALNEARVAIAAGIFADGTPIPRVGLIDTCCGAVALAWSPILVRKRRARSGASLISNLAAAAHYMLARYHVCGAKASQSQMNTVIDGYDARKRIQIARGDVDLSSMALTPGNRPFPPDFAIRNWAYKGSADGNADRLRCNPDASLPWVFPDVNGSEA